MRAWGQYSFAAGRGSLGLVGHPQGSAEMRTTSAKSGFPTSQNRRGSVPHYCGCTAMHRTLAILANGPIPRLREQHTGVCMDHARVNDVGKIDRDVVNYRDVYITENCALAPPTGTGRGFFAVLLSVSDRSRRRLPLQYSFDPCYEVQQ